MSGVILSIVNGWERMGWRDAWYYVVEPRGAHETGHKDHIVREDEIQAIVYRRTRSRLLA